MWTTQIDHNFVTTFLSGRWPAAGRSGTGRGTSRRPTEPAQPELPGLIGQPRIPDSPQLMWAVRIHHLAAARVVNVGHWLLAGFDVVLRPGGAAFGPAVTVRSAS